MRKSQVSNEFIVLAGISFVVLLGFLTIISDEISNINNEKEFKSISDLTFYIQHEIMTASDVQDGYTRTFLIPDKINGFDFDINNTADYILLKTKNRGVEQFMFIPSVEGNLTKGDNTIRKIGGVVHIN